MINVRFIFICLITVLMSGCTSRDQLELLNKELASVKNQLAVAQHNLATAEKRNQELNDKIDTLINNKSDDRSIETQAISFKLKAKGFAANYEEGVNLPLLHSLIFAEHISPTFAYIKKNPVKRSDSSISKYLGQIGGLQVTHYVLHLTLLEKCEVPLTVRNESEKIITDEILLVIDPEKKIPIVYIKIDDETFNCYEVDTRGMPPYNPDIWISPLIEHYKIFNRE